jgi:hypothetical protein
MLRQAKDLEAYKLRALDSDIGTVKEFYFDDRYWTVRYLVADTGAWLRGRRVLISPFGLGPGEAINGFIPVCLTKKQIEESPRLAMHEAISCRYEKQYYGYYGWSGYAHGSHVWGETPYIQRKSQEYRGMSPREDAWEPTLHSTREVTGHQVQGLDAEVGRVVDFLIDDETWTIRYLVVETKNGWSGKQVLVSPQWIERVSWSESKVFVSLPSATILRAPAFDPASFNRAHEAELHELYARPAYWVDAATADRATRPELNAMG